jgi:hypothetical protein
LSLFQSSISNLLNVVEKISPPFSTVALISDLGFVKVHSDTLTRKVSYFGHSEELKKMESSLQKRSRKGFLKSDNDEDISRNDGEQDVDFNNQIVQADLNQNMIPDDLPVEDEYKSSTSPYKNSHSTLTEFKLPHTNRPVLGEVIQPRTSRLSFQENMEEIENKIDSDNKVEEMEDKIDSM